MKRSRGLSLVLSALGVALLVSSCVIKSSDDDDDDTGGSGGQGTSGSGGSTSGGGTSGSGGGTSGGASGSGGGGTGATGGGDGGSSGSTGGAAGGGAAGDAGASGAGGGTTYTECIDCLADRCPNELMNCLDSAACFNGDGGGQYEEFSDCVEAERPFGGVNRILLRECGTQVIEGQVIWPPPGMSPATRDLINCLASGVADVNPDTPNNGWAEEPDVNEPWDPMSCARLACTAQTDQ